MKEVFLDLHQVELYGWEKYRPRTLVNSLLRGIALGDVFPPVFVCKNYGFYSLDQFVYDERYPQTEIRDGGHTRAYVHYLAQRPLRCVLTGESLLVSPPDGFILIKDMEIRDRYGEDHPLFGKVDLEAGALQKMALDKRYR